MQKQINIADILDQHGDCYINDNRISGQQKGLIHLLSACRTAGLGSHFEKCNQCSYSITIQYAALVRFTSKSTLNMYRYYTGAI